MITIIVPIWKHNVQFTNRFLNHLVNTKCNYKVLILSSVKDALTCDVDLNYEYYDNYTDINIHQFTYKLVNGIHKITTPYSIMVDNDDWICHQNFWHHIKFLEENPDYVSSRGKIEHYDGIKTQLCYDKPSILGQTATERFINATKNFHSNIHDIVRTEVLYFTHRLIYDTNVNDMKILIRMNTFIPSILGQINRDDTTYYFHDTRKPGLATMSNILPKGEIWFKTLGWYDSIKSMVYTLGTLINRIDHINTGCETVAKYIGTIDKYEFNETFDKPEILTKKLLSNQEFIGIL